MAKYGTFKYGSGTKYGTGAAVEVPPPPGDVVWIVNVWWNGSDAVNEAGRLINMTSFRGAEHYVNASGSGFESMRPGKATLTLSDPDRRYDPYNTSSPLYPYVLTGRDVQIAVYIQSTKETFPILTGNITDIQPVSGKNEVVITVEDGMRQLDDAEYSSGMLYSPTIDNAIDRVLTVAGWKGGKNLKSTNQPVQVFNPSAGNSLSIIHDLAEAALGTFFVDSRGNACFYPVSYTSTITTIVDESEVLKEIRMPQPWETVRNRVSVVANRKGRRPGSIIWNMAGITPFLSGLPNETREFYASFESSDTISQPQPYLDFSANSKVDGTGTDLTSLFTVSLSEIKSTECVVTVKNTSSTPAYFRYLRLIGHKIVSAPETFKAEDPASVAFYKQRKLSIDNPWLQDHVFASYYASWLSAFLKDPQQNLILQIDQRPTLQYALELMDHLNFTAASRGIDVTLHIRGIGHEWMEDTGQSVRTTLYLQAVYFNDTVLTPDPFVPAPEPKGTDTGYLPEFPFPEYPDWTPPIEEPYIPVDSSKMCILVDASTNGPFTLSQATLGLTNRLDDLTKMEQFFWYPCTLRKAGSINPSYIIINATWWAESPALVFDRSNQWWHVDAIDANKTVLCSGVITNIDDYNRKVTFSPTSPVEVAGFRMWLETKANSFGISTLVQSGTVAANSVTGTLLTTTLNSYYAIQGRDGPYDITNPNGACYAINIYDPTRMSGQVGSIRSDGYKCEMGSIGLKGEALNDNFGRIYFQALAATRVRVYDYNVDAYYADNTGSIGFELWNSSGPGPKILSLISAKIYNVCNTGII